MPLVSIITCAYNAEATVRRCHASVRSQTLQDWEHIVVDDGSSDQTSSILEQLAEKEPRLKVILQPGNEGAGRARNHGIEAAQGRFIAFIDSDDEWLPDKLRVQIDFMLSERVPFSYGSYYTADGDANAPRRLFMPPPGVDYPSLLRSCPIGCLTVAYDTDMFGKQYMPDVRRGQDWGLWLKLTRMSAMGARRYPGTYAVYYRTAGSISSGKVRKARDVWYIYRTQEGLSRTRALLNIGWLTGSSVFKRTDALSTTVEH